MMRAAGIEVDRSGQDGAVVEVYPAASLRIWKHTDKSYKGKDGRQVLRELATKFFGDVEWLQLSEADRELCLGNDDAFDAVIAALTARAQLKELVEKLTEDEVTTGRQEGWIALPLPDALNRLLD